MNLQVLPSDVCSEAKGLIDIDTACRRAASYAFPIVEVEEVAVHEGSGRILADDIVAAHSAPRFDQAAMDGYAVAVGDDMAPSGSRYPVSARFAAGDAAEPIATGQAARIFTGAPLPAGADAVLMQEHGVLDGGDLLLGRMLRRGENIRHRGEDIHGGQRLLGPGVRLDARHVALLASQGFATVRVQRRIRVGVISTGNELVRPGGELGDASIFDCNRPMLMALAARDGMTVRDGGWVPDEPARIAATLSELSSCCDLIVTTGGASVGEEDHSASAAVLAEGSIETLRIALKPGKPAVVGRIGSAAYVGLPGNPVSALVSWMIVVGAVSAATQGRVWRRSLGYPAAAAAPFKRRPGRTEFAPARLTPGSHGSLRAEILGPGGSARFRPLVDADGLVEIAALHAPVEPGDVLTFHPFGCPIVN
jgi:molybdopterin molybdotransferase